MALALTDMPFAGALDLLNSDPTAMDSYRVVVDVLQSIVVPRQTKTKSKPEYIYDQTSLQRGIRDELSRRRWFHEETIRPGASVGGVSMAAIKSGSIGPHCHLVLEFGNRASWAHNLVTRIAGTLERHPEVLTVLATPTHRFATHIDSNLATFERVTFELGYLASVRPEMIPGPLMVIGVQPAELGALT